MIEQNERERIRAYLAQNEATYTTAALRQKLIDDGFDAAAVDAVLRERSAASSASPAAAAGRLQFGQVYLGLALFGPLALAILYISSLATSLADISGTLLYLTMVLVLSGVAFALRRRSVALGLLAGYALLSMFSGGACTLLQSNMPLEGAILGVVLYPLMLLIVGVALLITRRRNT